MHACFNFVKQIEVLQYSFIVFFLDFCQFCVEKSFVPTFHANKSVKAQRLTEVRHKYASRQVNKNYTMHLQRQSTQAYTCNVGSSSSIEQSAKNTQLFHFLMTLSCSFSISLSFRHAFLQSSFVQFFLLPRRKQNRAIIVHYGLFVCLFTK